MKKLAIFFLAFAATFPALAQSKYGSGQDSVDCITNLSYYKEYLKQNNMADAIAPWRKAVALCPPAASQNMFIDGGKLLRWQYNQAKDAGRRAAVLDSLMLIHDIRVAHYPKYAVTALNNKAIDIINYKWRSNDPRALFDGFKNIVAVTGPSSQPVVFATYMKTAADLYKDGILDAETVMDTYNNIAGYIDSALKENPDAQMLSAKQDVETILGECGVASCDNLIEVFTPQYEAKPDDKATLSTIVKLLGNNDCLDNDLYLSAVEKLHAIEPTANTAYFLYKLYSSRDQLDEAAASLLDAIDLCGDDTKTAADYCFELGTFYYKKMQQNADAANAALKAIELNEAIAGKCYLLLGTIWGCMKCSGNEIDSRAQFWVAVDYMNKATAADPSLESEASSLSAQYRKYFPQQADAFMYDAVDGNSYTVSCSGLRATTTVRTQK